MLSISALVDFYFILFYFIFLFFKAREESLYYYACGNVQDFCHAVHPTHTVPKVYTLNIAVRVLL